MTGHTVRCLPPVFTPPTSDPAVLPPPTVPPLFRTECDRVLDASPELAHRLSQSTLAALRSSSTDLSLAQDRRLLFTVQEALQAHQHVFEQTFVQQLRQEVAEAMQALSPSTVTTSASPLTSLDQLSLVDDEEAEAAIAISRVVHQVELEAEWELAEWQAFCAVLLNERRIQAELNPLRPAVYAQALGDAAGRLGLPNAGRQMLLRLAAEVLARELKQIYAQASLRVRQQGIEPLGYRPIVQASAPVTPRVDVSQPGQLDALLHRLPSAPGSASTHLDPALASLLAASHAGDVDLRALSGLVQLLQQMMTEAGAQPGVRGLLQQLQPSFVKLAVNDPQVFDNGEHPGWQLINELVSYTTGFTRQEDAALQAFLEQVQPLIQRLVQLPSPETRDYTTTLDEVRALIERQNAELLESRQAALRALEEADQREALKPLLRQQVEHQLAGKVVPLAVGDFLQGPWIEVMALAMTHPDMPEAESQRLLNVVDELVLSLQRPTSLEERELLRGRLPELTSDLRKGMAMIEMPVKERSTFMEQLMAVHGRYLRATPQPRPELTPEQIVQQMREETLDSVWSQHDAEPDTRIDDLPTIPLGLDGKPTGEQPGRGPNAWVDHLRVGVWCKLASQGRWSTNRIVWISPHRNFFVVTSQRSGQLHNFTRSALLRLRKEGLATELPSRSPVQSAADTLARGLSS